MAEWLGVSGLLKTRAKRILEARDTLFRWGSATRGQLTAEQRERLNAMSLDDVMSAPADI